jgi:hypothetical protein
VKSSVLTGKGREAKFVEVRFGVRQGLILGPILFLLHTADMAAAISTQLNVTYADDSNVWAVANSLGELKDKLEELAGKFATWAKKRPCHECGENPTSCV